jgi:hypothetical protein
MCREPLPPGKQSKGSECPPFACRGALPYGSTTSRRGPFGAPCVLAPALVLIAVRVLARTRLGGR